MAIRLSTTETRDAFSKDIVKSFQDQYSRPERMAKRFWGITKHDVPYLEYKSFGSFGSVPEWNGQIEYDEFDSVFSARITPSEYAMGYKVDHNTWRWAMKGNEAAKEALKVAPRMFGYRFYELIEEAMHAPFNDGFDTLTTLDGVVLFSASHTPDAAGTYTNNNLLTTPLSQAAIEAARLLGRGSWVDDRGKITVSNLTGLVCDATLESSARVLTGTDKIPASANNDENYLKYYGFEVYPTVRTSDSNNWFLFDPNKIKESFLWNQNRGVSFQKDEDFDTKYKKFSGDTMFMSKVIDPLCIVGMNVAG